MGKNFNYICLLCRYLKAFDDNCIEFGTGELKNYICGECLDKLRKRLK